MKYLASRRRLYHLHIGVSTQLDKPFQTRRTVFWTLTLIAVRQHERDAVDTTPLHFTRSDELVNYDLGPIGKVAELCFPDHQCIGIVRRVAVFISEHCFFRQDGVDNNKRSLTFGYIL